MREYYLVPKHTYRPNSEDKRKKIEGEWKTQIPPSSTDNPRSTITHQRHGGRLLKKKKQKKTTPVIPLRELDYNYRSSVNQTNPSLSELLPFNFSKSKIPTVRSLLNHFERSNTLKWSQEGDLYHPINDVNILNLIHDMISNRSIFSENEINTMKYIIFITNTSLTLISSMWQFIFPHLSLIFSSSSLKPKCLYLPRG